MPEREATCGTTHIDEPPGARHRSFRRRVNEGTANGFACGEDCVASIRAGRERRQLNSATFTVAKLAPRRRVTACATAARRRRARDLGLNFSWLAATRHGRF